MGALSHRLRFAGSKMAPVPMFSGARRLKSRSSVECLEIETQNFSAGGEPKAIVENACRGSTSTLQKTMKGRKGRRRFSESRAAKF
jgi:hypothetical protein